VAAEGPVQASRAVALAWLEQPGGDRRYVESETRIGRGEQNNIRLDDPSVSRNHAIIRRVDGRYVISDLGSANSTLVNDERIHVPRALDSGDRIRVANTQFTFYLDTPSSPGAEPLSHPGLGHTVGQFFTSSSGDLNVTTYVDGDLRVVTVVFLDLHGFTALSETVSPEQITVVMNQCFERLTEIAAHFGGHVDKYVGDGMMVLFGAPRAQADHAERAVRAALAMQAALERFSERLHRRAGLALRMRVGINSGEVLAGRVGAGQFSAFTVMGDTVNLASRLEGATRVGHILVGQTTYQLTQDVVRYAPLEPIQVKGKQKPVQVYEVEGIVDRADMVEPLVPLVGREDELAWLEEVLTEPGDGWRSVVVVGEPGVGKSRLLDELQRRHASEVRWARVRCAEYEQGMPYAALRGLAHALADEPLAADQDGQMLEETFARLVRRAAADNGVVVVLDNADCADPTTRQALDQASATVMDARVLVLIARRQDGPDTGARVLHLQPLADEDATRLVTLALSGDIEAERLEQVMRRSAGNPLALLELGRAVHVPAAHALRAVTQARLDRLAPSERDVLRLGAVFGEPFNPSLVAAALDQRPLVEELLGHLVELGYLLESTAHDFAFRQPFVADVIAASLPELQQRRLHERAALALQLTEAGAPERILEHLRRAGRLADAVEYRMRRAEGAGDAAVAEYRATLREAEQVRSVTDRRRLLLALHERIGDTLLRQANLAEAQIAFESACDLSPSSHHRAELRCKLAVVAQRRGSHRRVLDLAAAVAAEPDVLPPARARTEALAALSLAALGELDQATQRAEHAQALAADAADRAARGLAAYSLAAVHFLAGRCEASLAAAHQSAAERSEAADSAGWLETQFLLGLVAGTLGDEPAVALDTVRAALATCGPAADPWQLARGATVFGRLLVDQGQHARGARHLVRALRLAERIGAREVALEARLALARSALADGHPGERTLALSELRAVERAAAALELAPLALRARVAAGGATCSST
jgi:class 3 adenylate cyclase/tetratricopeptide (TPR) repeat protein